MIKKLLLLSTLLVSIVTGVWASTITWEPTGTGNDSVANVTTLTGEPSTLQTLYNNTASHAESTPHYYRIPAIAKDKDGNLYAYADFRGGSGNDIGGNTIDIMVRKSSDNGVTWGTASTAVAHSGTSGFDYAHGDAAVVADRDGQGFLMMCASGSVGYGSSTASNPIRVGRYTSADGITWTGSDITTAVYGVNSSLTRAFFSSGRICQSRFIKVGSYYRLYAAMCTNLGSLVVYSDDFGVTWKQLGSSVPTTTDGNEAKIEELPNGNVLLSSRAATTSVNGRYFNIFTYTSKTDAQGAWFSSPITSNNSTEGVYTQDCSCNGEILIIPAKDASGNCCYVALQSIPKGPGRNNLVVYYKVLSSKTDFDTPLDFETGWSLLKQINSTTSCYSTMILDANGDIAFMYEENYDGTNGYDVKFQTLSLSAITSGAYTYWADL